MIRAGLAFAVVAGLAACAPSKVIVPPGQLGMVMDLTSENRGQCELVGPGISVEKLDVLGGDYFKATGDLLRSTFRCTLANGQTVATTSHHEFFDQGGFNYAAIIVNPILGPGEVEIIGYIEGENGKVDVTGTYVFGAI